MALLHRATQLIDDDGAMFLATSRYLESLQRTDFDYDFTRTATQGLRCGMMVPWTLPLEAEHDICVVELARAPRDWDPTFLFVGSGDRAVLLSWAALTQVIDGGAPEASEGLVDIFELPPAWYEVVVGEPAVMDVDDSDGDIRLETTVSLVRRSHAPAAAELLRLEIPTRGRGLDLE